MEGNDKRAVPAKPVSPTKKVPPTAPTRNPDRNLSTNVSKERSKLGDSTNTKMENTLSKAGQESLGSRDNPTGGDSPFNTKNVLPREEDKTQELNKVKEWIQVFEAQSAHDRQEQRLKNTNNEEMSSIPDLGNRTGDFLQQRKTGFEGMQVQQEEHFLISNKANISNRGSPKITNLRKVDNPTEDLLHHMRTEFTPVRHARGLVVGCAGAGKTTLLYSLMGKSLDEIKEIKSTRGLQVYEHIFTVTDNGDFRATEKIHRDSLVKVPKTLLTKKSDPSNIGKDKAEATVAETIPLEVIKKILDAQENEISVSMIDFAGQFAYYACHQIYMRSSAFYILVMDMSKSFEDDVIGEEEEQKGSVFSTWKYKDYVEYWLNSIKTFGGPKAPVLIVVTHREGKTDDEIKDYFACFWRSLTEEDREWLSKNIRGNNLAFELINIHEEERSTKIKSLKNTLVEIVAKELCTEIPVRSSWALLEHRLLDTGKPIMSYEEIQKMNRELPEEFRLESEEEIPRFLECFHEHGIVLFFNGEATRTHAILDIQWFSDGFSRLIADKKHINEDCRQRHIKEWELFNLTGKLNSTLVDALWKEKAADEENTRSYMKYKYELIAYMERLRMLVSLGDTDKDQSWYVPCMNKNPFKKYIFKEYTACSSVLCFRFNSFALFVFYRLIAYCMSSLKWKVSADKQDRCLFQTAAVFEYRNHIILLGICENDIQLQVLSLVINTDISFEVGCIIYNALEELTQTFENTYAEREEMPQRFQRGYKCQKKFCDPNDPSFIPVEEISLSGMEEVLCSWCSIEEEHSIRVHEILRFWNQIPIDSNEDSSKDISSDDKKIPIDSDEDSGEDISSDDKEAKKQHGELFHKILWNAIPLEHTQIIGGYEIEKRVGRIQLNGEGVGTGFRVGSKYVMTAYHVMKKHLEEFWKEVRKMLTKEERKQIKWTKKKVPVTGSWKISNLIALLEKQKKDKLKSLARDFLGEFEIKFEFLKNDAKGRIAKFTHDVAFASPDHDVLVLELEEQESERRSFDLVEKNIDGQMLRVFGHPNGIRLQHDPACSIINTEKELSDLKQKGITFFKKRLREKDGKIEGSYDSCVFSEDNILFHSCRSTIHGASGAPLTIIKNDIPKVYGMLLCGHPGIYYNSSLYGNMKRPELLVESGISMQKVRSLLEFYLPELEQELFDP